MSDDAAGGEGQWITVKVFSTESAAVSAALFEAGAQSVQETSDALITHVPDQATANALLCAALEADPRARVETEPLPNVDWSEQWKRGIHAQAVRTLTIVPPWLAVGRDMDRTIVIEPAMAFGTGEHATTRGVVRLLHDVIRDGDRVADLGAGSAVLAIAAVKLGAARVAAIEIDHDAIGNAEENIARNGVADRVSVLEGDAATLLPLVAPVRVITANILSSVLIVLLPVLSASLASDGEAILSGILASERDEMVAELERSGWLIRAEDHEDAWWSTTIARR